jgi:hypothetical protein
MTTFRGAPHVRHLRGDHQPTEGGARWFSHTNASLALAVDRRIKPAAQAGARPMTSFQYLLELQRDWARSVTYDATIGLVKTFGGAYGLGVIYAKSMLGVRASEAGEAP